MGNAVWLKVHVTGSCEYEAALAAKISRWGIVTDCYIYDWHRQVECNVGSRLAGVTVPGCETR